MSHLDFWRTTALLIAAVGQTTFVLLYLRLRWYRTYTGRALFTKAFTFACLLNTQVASRIWDWSGEDATIVGLYGLVSIGIWSQVTAFVRQGRKDRRNHLEDHR